MNYKLLILLVVGIGSTGSQAFAGKYLSQDQISESINFLPPPPAPGSPVDEQDTKTLESIDRSPEACSLPNAEALLQMPLPFQQPMGPMTSDEIKSMTAFTEAVYYEVKPILKGVKNNSNFVRPRPYLTDAKIIPCVPKEDTNSYPSAHATYGELYGLIFGNAFIDRAGAFLTRGKQYGYDRVIGGVHHPSDVLAGQNLADHVFAELLKSAEFRADLEDAKAGKFVAPAQK